MKRLTSVCLALLMLNLGTTAQFGGASGDVFSAICGMQIPRFTSSKPSEFAFASDKKSIRQPTASFVRCYLYIIGVVRIRFFIRTVVP